MKEQALLDAMLRSDFVAFVEKVFSTVCPDQMFSPNWHVNAICWEMDQVIAEKTQQLIVNLPPRSLKSIIVSIALPAFILGRSPSQRIICVSYSEELANEHARQFRRVVESAWYKRIFPNMRLDRRKNTESMVATTRNGFRLATSIGGTLTGRGGNLIIIDDPIKAGGAQSELERQKVIDWYTSTLVTRRDDPSRSAIILVMQRVHPADLSGYLLDAGGWTHLKLPVIADLPQTIQIGDGIFKQFEAGECLDPTRLPKETLEQLRDQIGSFAFSAQYQQEPFPSQGNIIRHEWISTFEMGQYIFPPSRIVQSWDTAAKIGSSNDYSVCVTAAVLREGIFVLDVLRTRANFPGLVQLAREQIKKHKPRHLLVEDTANGMALLDVLKHEVNPPPIGIQPKMDKETRVHLASAKFESGRVRFLKDALWLPNLIRELVRFPNDRHDDQVDALVQLILWAYGNENTFFLPNIQVAVIPKMDGFSY